MAPQGCLASAPEIPMGNRGTADSGRNRPCRIDSSSSAGIARGTLKTTAEKANGRPSNQEPTPSRPGFFNHQSFRLARSFVMENVQVLPLFNESSNLESMHKQRWSVSGRIRLRMSPGPPLRTMKPNPTCAAIGAAPKLVKSQGVVTEKEKLADREYKRRMSSFVCWSIPVVSLVAVCKLAGSKSAGSLSHSNQAVRPGILGSPPSDPPCSSVMPPWFSWIVILGLFHKMYGGGLTMTIISSTRADVPVVIIDQGRLTDDLTLQELYEEIVAEVASGKKKNVVLDFELVETVTSPGLSMLIRAKIKFDEKGAKLHLCGLGANVAEVIRATSLSRLFPVHHDVASALRTI